MDIALSGKSQRYFCNLFRVCINVFATVLSFLVSRNSFCVALSVCRCPVFIQTQSFCAFGSQIKVLNLKLEADYGLLFCWACIVDSRLNSTSCTKPKNKSAKALRCSRRQNAHPCDLDCSYLSCRISPPCATSLKGDRIGITLAAFEHCESRIQLESLSEQASP